MNRTTPTVRPLAAADVPALVRIIAASRREFVSDERERALLDAADRDLVETYRARRAAYFVACVDGVVVGGAGISRLDGDDGSVCELKRMHVDPGHRGLGIGRRLLEHCLAEARRLGYRECYAEAVAGMHTAIALCERQGFRALASRRGDRGPGFLDRWFLRTLEPVTLW